MTTQTVIAMRRVPDDSTLGARLALIEQAMGWNETEAARECDISQTSWRNWKRYNHRPRNLQEIASKISRRTGYDLDWVMRGTLHPGEWSQDPGGGPSGGGAGASTTDPASGIVPLQALSSRTDLAA